MRKSWTPSSWGKRVTGAADWRIELGDSELRVELADSVIRTGVGVLENATVRRGLVWSAVDLHLNGERVLLKGLPAKSARGLSREFADVLDRHRRLIRTAELRAAFDQATSAVQYWVSDLEEATRSHTATKGWLTREFRLLWESRRPDVELLQLLREPLLADHVSRQDVGSRRAVGLWTEGLAKYVAAHNDDYLRRELREQRTFFDRIERSPLTDEQARAVVCFDNRVQVIASAGSGKTSTMVAKAAYAVHRNLVAPEKILLLAFNDAAATELKSRVRERLRPLGIKHADITVKTFHAFGLGIIGAATARKPALAPWLGTDEGREYLKGIVTDLRATDAAFRWRWDFFRLVLCRDLPPFGREHEEPEDRDPKRKVDGFRTMQGEVVKSRGERMIADWLYYNGVRYVYESPYKHDTADANHSQYHPDFYYPDIDTYHEHLALNSDGAPPAEFEGYLDGVVWKRGIHRKFGTDLLETTMAELRDGTAFEYLARELTARGVILKPDTERPVRGRPPLDDSVLMRIFRTFLSHAKSNQLDDDALSQRLRIDEGFGFGFRDRMFLDLFGKIRERWDGDLRAGNFVDFEDMLNLASDYLESGTESGGYELIMVDEMQDSSNARARLLRALANLHGVHLFAVGDDWQSINRFAGADLSVMTMFDRWFGESVTLRLERTFRSPQGICDAAGEFIQRNPHQLPKRVVSSAPDYPSSINAVVARSESDHADVIMARLTRLNSSVRDGIVRTGTSGRLSVLILGRYRRQLDDMASALRRRTDGRRFENIDVKFHTMHSSKGMEADYTVILGMVRSVPGRSGFPSAIEDDRVLRLAQPAAEDFPLAEERRLFYVALTRAKRSVLLLTVQGKESPFLVELIRAGRVAVSSTDGTAYRPVVCPQCQHGLMTERSGPSGSFLSCARFPACTATRSIDGGRARFGKMLPIRA